MFDISHQKVLHADQARRIVEQHDIIDAEVGLQGSQLVQLVEKDFRLHVFSQFHDNADAVLVGRFIAHVSNAFNDLVSCQRCNSFKQAGFIHHIGYFIDNNAGFAVGHFLNSCPGTHDNRTAPCFKSLADA